MIVIVIAMGVVQMDAIGFGISNIIIVVPMRHHRVRASCAVLMLAVAGNAVVIWCVSVGIGFRHGECVLHRFVAIHVMHVAVVEIVCVALVLHCGVATCGAVLVCVIWMKGGLLSCIRSSK